MDADGPANRDGMTEDEMRAAMVSAARRAEFEEVLGLREDWWASLEAEGADHVEAARSSAGMAIDAMCEALLT
jgi:hypothetical protein